MTPLAQTLAKASANLDANQEAARAFDATYRFVLAGAEGGIYMLTLTNTEVSLREHDGEADCSLNLHADDLVALLEGRATAQQLFFSGKLGVTGNLGLAVRLSQVVKLLA